MSVFLCTHMLDLFCSCFWSGNGTRSKCRFYFQKTAQTLTLDVGEDRILLETRSNVYHLDIYLPYNIIQEDVGAQFDRCTKVNWSLFYILFILFMFAQRWIDHYSAFESVFCIALQLWQAMEYGCFWSLPSFEHLYFGCCLCISLSNIFATFSCHYNYHTCFLRYQSLITVTWLSVLQKVEKNALKKTVQNSLCILAVCLF